MFRCNRGQSDFQRWMVRYEIAKRNSVDAWLEITTPRPDPAGAALQAEARRLREALQARQREAAQLTYIGALAGLEAHVTATGAPAATDAINEAAIQTVRRREEELIFSRSPIALLPAWLLSWPT